MKTELTKIAQDLEQGTITDQEARKLLLGLLGVGGSHLQFIDDIFKLINAYAKNGLSKPDLVLAMEWITGSCKTS